MSIRFCEFCSTVHPDEATHCPDCGARLDQSASEDYFNDRSNPWPFVPIDTICLHLQGKPLHIRFSGTHSVFHLWSTLHSAYEQMTLCCHAKGEELELASYPAGRRPAEYKTVDPVMLMGSRHRKFSLYTYQEADPEVATTPGELEMTYHGSFEIEDCPPKYWRDILGWLVATEPRPEIENSWTYEMT